MPAGQNKRTDGPDLARGCSLPLSVVHLRKMSAKLNAWLVRLKDTTKMPKKCNVYGCHGNYRGEPYTKSAPFPKDKEERSRWIDATPNDRSRLLKRREIYACLHHFDCDWVKMRGGKRPSEPPSIFPGVAPSCLKQCTLFWAEKGVCYITYRMIQPGSVLLAR